MYNHSFRNKQYFMWICYIYTLVCAPFYPALQYSVRDSLPWQLIVKCEASGWEGCVQQGGGYRSLESALLNTSCVIHCTALWITVYCSLFYTVLPCVVHWTTLCCALNYPVFYTVLLCVLHCTALCCTLYCPVLYTVLPCVVHRTALCFILYCPVLCTELPCRVLPCGVHCCAQCCTLYCPCCTLWCSVLYTVLSCTVHCITLVDLSWNVVLGPKTHF